jgi:hypothetical protein
MPKKEDEKKLIRIENEGSILEILEKIKANEHVVVSIHQDAKGKILTWETNHLFAFDVCLHGDQQYNAVSVIRDLLKHYHPDGHWTRKKVTSLVSFGAKTTQ